MVCVIHLLKTISTWISDGQVERFLLMPEKYTFVETAAQMVMRDQQLLLQLYS